MPDYQWVPTPVFTPTTCLGCNAHRHEDGFVDTLAEDAAGRRLYLCAECVRQAARKVGCYAPKEVADLKAEVAAANARAAELEDELAVERANKVVSLADVKKILKEGKPLARDEA